MRALVTGGAGFIGSHLCEFLLNEGHDVEAFDDLSTGQVTNLPKGAKLLVASASSPEIVDHAVAHSDIVFHLAAVVGVQRVLERPLETIETNTQCTSIVLRACAKYRRPVLIASSSEVYGDSGWAHENAVLTISPGLRWGYAAAKLLDEFTALAHARQGLHVVVVRLFNTIGPRQTGQYGMVVPRFIAQALAGLPITIYGDGNQRRSFTWVGDVAKAMYDLLMEPRAHSQIVNIGHTDDISIASLAYTIREVANSRSPFQFSLYAEAFPQLEGHFDIANRKPDLTKIQDLIGYRPTLNIVQMIETIVASNQISIH